MIDKRHNTDIQRSGHPFHILGNPETTKNFIPVDYVAKIISLLIETDGAWERSFHLTHADPLTLKTLMSYVKKSMDWPSMAFSPMEALPKLSPLERRFFNGVKVYDKYFWQEPVFDRSQLKSALGADLPLPSPISQDSVNRIVDFVREKYTERQNLRKDFRTVQ